METKKVIETLNEKETGLLGETMGKAAVPGSIYTLRGDLGVGKTVFSQGFARGLGITEHVNSPTFTKKDACRFIILTYTVSGMWRKWKKSGMKTAFSGRASV